ncbi:unnamed protein product, partial [Symbiodinium microadriaticum]
MRGMSPILAVQEQVLPKHAKATFRLASAAEHERGKPSTFPVASMMPLAPAWHVSGRGLHGVKPGTGVQFYLRRLWIAVALGCPSSSRIMGGADVLSTGKVPPAAASRVVIKPDAEAVAFELCAEVARAAKEAVAARGAFVLAIPGGSILKMLVTGSSQLEGVEWDKGVLAYVNHKCVPNDDASKKVLVASAGVSEKYPMGKSEAMKKAIEGMEGPRAFPAQALRSTACYLLDEAAASSLSEGKSVMRAAATAELMAPLFGCGSPAAPSAPPEKRLLSPDPPLNHTDLVTPRHAGPIAEASVSRNLEPALREAAPVEAGAAFLEDESADYPLCEGLPRNGIRVIDTAHVISTNCTWHGHPGLQVTLKETLTFQGTLVLKGEIQIMGEQELDGPCINVSGKMTVIAANASFVGCRNRMKDGKGGALFIQRDLIVSNSSVKFENCRASAGGGLYTGSFLQEAESTVTFENCFGNAGGGAHVRNDFTQGPKSSAIFRSCSANGFGGGLYTGSFLQEAESMVTFENCTGASSLSGGGASVKENFTQGRKSSAIFRNG